MAEKKQSSGGSGGGAVKTAAYESLQAYCCSARMLKKSPLEDISEVKTSRISAARCTDGLSSAIKTLDEAYYYSTITTANQIFNDFGFLSKGGYTFYRGSFDEVAKVYGEFNRLKKGSGITNANKWNPADIWIVKNTFTFKGGFETLEQLNEYLETQYKKGTLIGVSLKKLGKGSPAQKTVYNMGKAATAQFSGFKTGGLTDSKDVYIEFSSQNKQGLLQLRTFSSRPVTSSWQGEIKGKTAAGGKIGGGVLIQSALQCNVPSSYITAPNSFQSQVNKPSENTWKEFAKMWKTLTGSKDRIEDIIKVAKQQHKGDKSWWVSKYLGVSYCYGLKRSGKENDVTNVIFQYGSSATKSSSVFVKYS